jgi:starch phosphorylase
MAFLSIVCSHNVNGVAAIHSQILKDTIFKEFDEMFPGMIQNKTNGVTPRRWIHCCNPGLSALISDQIGPVEDWITELDSIREIAGLSGDHDFQAKFNAIKLQNKINLKNWVKERTGIDIPTDALYDIQVKRIHEYKRQIMNVFYVIHRYLTIKDTPAHERADKFVPRVIMIGGKSAPGYYNAKCIIKMFNNVADKINNDPDVGDLLKCVFLPNYNVSSAQIIIPAAELSQHISTAGTEASGTSNMKFVMNGCLIIGTMDGANVEIAEEIGEENMFIFGARVEKVNGLREEMHNGKKDYAGSRLMRVFKNLKSGTFGDLSLAHGMLDSLLSYDHYLNCHDFYSYIEAQERVDKTYKNQHLWTKMAIEGVAKSGKFSSDRTIREYCNDIWKIEGQPIPKPTKESGSRVHSHANLSDLA